MTRWYGVHEHAPQTHMFRLLVNGKYPQSVD